MSVGDGVGLTLGGGGVVVRGGERKGGGCDLGSQKVGDGDSYN